MSANLQQICITGIGIVSAIGLNADETLQSLMQEHSGIGPLRFLQTSHHEFPVGEVPLSNDELKDRLQISAHQPTTRTSLLGMMALHEALNMAHLSQEQQAKVALISGTTVGGMDKSEQYYLDYIHNDNRNDYIKTHDCGACTEMIADKEGRFAAVTTLSTACSSAANAIMLGANMIQLGEYECVVVGGAECITKFHLNGFNSLMILDTDKCRPFDDSRAGLNLGEGAAFLVLESEAHAHKRNVMPLALLSGYGNACDAYHQTASSPDGEGAYLAMSKALKMAHLASTDIEYINAHGTGTPNNDASESAAIRRIFGDKIPAVSSSKSFTGHTTSAAGSIDAVISILALRHAFLPANLNWTDGGSGVCVTPVKRTQFNVQLKHILCNAFGFGGNDTALVLSAIHETTPETKSQQPYAEAAQKKQSPISISTSQRHVYVQAATQISLQMPLCESWMDSPLQYQEPFVRSIDPDFKSYINPMEARRMGKVLKRAIVTSSVALQQAGIKCPDAIITGTGLGCIENTELFLTALCTEGEQMLKPTYFMQSTHNTISSVVAIQQKDHGYNATYSHKSISFDSALYDAYQQMQLGLIDNALVGGHDEMTPSYYQFLKKVHIFGQGHTVVGESASSVVLSSQGDGLCNLCGVKLIYKPTYSRLKEEIKNLLQCNTLTEDDLDGVMTDVCGDADRDRITMEEVAGLLPTVPMLRYKHLFGEGYTMSGLALYTVAHCLAQHRVPGHLYVNVEQQRTSAPKAILLLNRGDGKDYALTLLSNK